MFVFELNQVIYLGFSFYPILSSLCCILSDPVLFMLYTVDNYTVTWDEGHAHVARTTPADR